jgi:hypothetical protein
MIDKINITNTSNEGDFDYKSAFDECIVDLDAEMVKPPIAISVGHYLYDNESHYLPAYTYGEFSATVAPSKTKKSFFKSALIASYIGGNSNEFFPQFKTHRKEDHFIVDIDTEQGKYYAQNVFRRVAKMTGGLYQNYLPFSMRSKTPLERVLFIEGLLKDPKYLGKIKFISIDGIADLVENTNDIVMSNNIASKVLKWTDQGIHLHTVIHKLTNVDKPTGHLGSYILKKAETVVFLSKNEQDDSLIDVEHKYARGRKFENFSFAIDRDGLPYVSERENFTLS